MRWTESDSVDGRWQKTDLGHFFSGSISLPGQPIPKGLVVRVGERQEAAVCYDTQLYRVGAGWTGGFVQIHPARFGLITPQTPAGQIQFTSPVLPGWSPAGDFADRRKYKPYGPLPQEEVAYRGFHVRGNRLTMDYSVAGVKVWESPWLVERADAAVFTRSLNIAPSRKAIHLLVCGPDGRAAVRSSAEQVTLEIRPGVGTIAIIPSHDSRLDLVLAIVGEASRQTLSDVQLDQFARTLPLEDLTPQPGPARWTADIQTRGVRGADTDAYVIDTLTLPFDNPYRALFFVGGHDFLPNGELVICTVHGDVWRVRGVNDTLESLTWKRQATGLFQPLGLRVVGDQVFVVGRDQITKLHDRNGDGEFDFYENLNNEGHTTMNAHEYVTCLETDREGNFYFLKGNSDGQTAHDGALLRVPADGSRLELFATGFRNANGMGIGPDGTITVAPQEGEWTPASAIFKVRQGGFYGFVPSSHQTPKPKAMEPPICWLSRRQDNSSGGQVWVESDAFGPLSRKMIHLSYGQSVVYPVLQEEVDGQTQAATFTMPLKFDSGVMRGRFHKGDGHLYLSGLLGWVTNARSDGCLQRVRYTGKKVAMPTRIATYRNGVAITMSEPLDRASAEDPGNYQVQQWNYLWAATYGSPEYKVSQPKVEGRDDVDVVSATLLDDGQTLFLEIESVVPANILSLQYQIKDARGEPLSGTLNHTIYRIPNRTMDTSLLHRPSHPDGIDPKAMRPGLALTVEQAAHGKSLRDELVVRTASLWVGEKSAATSRLLPGSVTATFTGYLKIPLNGDVRFAAEGTGIASVTVDGKSMLREKRLSPQVGSGDVPNEPFSGPIRLRKGWHPITVTYEGPAGGGADFRLLWQQLGHQSEPIPAEWLSHRSVDDGPTPARQAPAQLAAAQLAPSRQTRQGLDLFLRHRCGQCHAIPDSARALKSELELPRNAAPSLSFVASHFREAWLRAWLLDPHALRSNASMPRLLGDPASSNAVREAGDLTAYLLGEFRANGKAARDATDADGGDAQRGLLLYEQWGCIACHHFGPDDAPEAAGRLSLRFVGAKFRPRAIATYLQDPVSHFPGTGMPKFRLTEQDANDLEAHVREQSKGGVASPAEKGSADRGRELFVSRQCNRCHALPDRPIQPGSLTALRKDRLSAGCLGDAPAGQTPVWQFDAASRAALMAFCQSLDTFVSPESAVERSQRLVQRLQCAACHPRDGRGAAWPERLFEESDLGQPPENVPSLTWTGEKLWSDWSRRLIAGEFPDRTRPWMKAQMPAFPNWAEDLAIGFAAEHGRAPGTRRDATAPSHSPDQLAQLVGIGHRLTFKNQGLDCRQCHAIGAHKPEGDQTTNLAIGINFVQSRDRLRVDYYRRFVLDPPRYEASTRMPKLASDGVRTNVTSLWDGDAAKQFDAIWLFIQSLDDRGDSTTDARDTAK